MKFTILFALFLMFALVNCGSYGGRGDDRGHQDRGGHGGHQSGGYDDHHGGGGGGGGGGHGHDDQYGGGSYGHY